MSARLTMPTRCWLPVVIAACLAGCAVTPYQRDTDAARRTLDTGCVTYLTELDAAVAHAGVGDGMAARVAGFRYARVNRLLASYAVEPISEPQFKYWAERMLDLGLQAYQVEIANLPAADAARLTPSLAAVAPAANSLHEGVKICAARLFVQDLAHAEAQNRLRAAARVPDDYAAWKRVAGLYFLTRIAFAAGVRHWQDETRDVFARPLFMLPTYGVRIRYAPPTVTKDADVAAIHARSRDNPLRIPQPRGADLEALFAMYAPEFEVDTVSADDRAGELGWFGGDMPAVDAGNPVVYRRISHTRYQGEALLQLNYSIWFPARPKTSPRDLLGGNLDGVTWRVTLAPDGSPWVYDCIHNCGCFHLFFPTARAGLKILPATRDETAFVPQTLPRVAAGERLTLRLENGTHYLQRVIVESADWFYTMSYRFGDDDELRSRPLPEGGRRSIFGPDGIVRGSERAERYWFWPMGIAEPGAMRQWGRHATAFVGRRHFDDADLFEKYFDMKKP